MRQIGTIEGGEPARVFSNLLTVEGIRHQVDREEGDAFTVWVWDEDRVAQATDLLARWREDPSTAVAPETAVRAELIRRREERAFAEARKQMARARPRLGGPAGIAPVTFGLIAASVLVAILSKLGENDAVLRWLTITGYRVQGPYAIPNPPFADVLSGQVWRLVTPIFIHFGILHIFFNLWWTKDLGSAIERHHGLRVFVPLLLLTAILPNIAQYVFGGSGRFGGMSGVVYGLLGYIWMRGKFDPLSGVHLPQDIVMFMILWFFLGVFEVIPHIANWAHGVGLGTGMAFGFVMAKLFPSFRLR